MGCTQDILGHYHLTPTTTEEEILRAAEAILERRFQRGDAMTDPEAAGRILKMRLAHIGCKQLRLANSSSLVTSSSPRTVGTDMKTIALAALCLMPLLASCQGEERKPVEEKLSYCGISKATDADPCEISVYTLAAHPDYFDGKSIRVSGFYSHGLDQVLFFDRDSSENVIFKNSLALIDVPADQAPRLDRYLNKYAEIQGTFTRTFNHPGEFSPRSYGQFLGTLAVKKVGSKYDTSTPYACWDPQRDRSKDPKTVRALLGEEVCNDSPLMEPAPQPN